jgi:multidrug resistance efflux pump
VESHEIHIGSKIGGRIAKVLVDEGDIVKAEQLIAVFEAYDLTAKKAQAEAEVSEAEANLEKLNHGPRAQEIDKARFDLNAAQSDYKNALLNYNQFEALYRRGIVSRQEYENAKTRSEQASARKDSLHKELDLLLAGTRQEDITAAEAALRMKRANLSVIETQLSEIEVKAPANAVVEVIDVRPSDLIPSDSPIATLLEPDQLYVRVYVPETRLGLLALDKPVEIKVDSFPKETFSGTIEQIATQGEFTPRNIQTREDRVHQVFAVKVRIENREGLLRAGMAADVIIKNGSGK